VSSGLKEHSCSVDPNRELAHLYQAQPLQTRFRSDVSARQVDYEVLLHDTELARALRPLQAWTKDRDFLVVTTPTVYRLYGSVVSAVIGNNVEFLVLDCDEKTKDLTQVERVCRAACSKSLSRRGLLVGLGGGVCMDITTVAASWLRRGMQHIRIPTTLIGQVDAGIGCKGAVNFDGHKSFIGCFHAPSYVLLAPEFLYTLPLKQLREGFAEIVKIAIVRDAKLLELIERHGDELIRTAYCGPRQIGIEIIWRAVLRMLEELSENPFEDQTYERLVDYGHTFSPLLECASTHQLSHGEAVAIDIALTTTLSTELGLTRPAFRDRILGILTNLGLPIYSSLLTLELCKKSLSQAALHRGGKPNLVLPIDTGVSQFLGSATSISEGQFVRALEGIASYKPLA
jgi:2-epi-5-epi-valiolone synthase